MTCLCHILPLLFFSGLAFAAPTYPVIAYSTYLRDSFTPKAIATDSSGNIYLTGNAIAVDRRRRECINRRLEWIAGFLRHWSITFPAQFHIHALPVSPCTR